MYIWIKVSRVLFVLVLFLGFSRVCQATDQRLTVYGDFASVGIPSLAAAIAYNKNDKEGIFELLEGSIVTVASTEVIKHATDMDRPDGTKYSFPSGHTSLAMQGAAFLQFRYGSLYGVPAFAAAAVVGYSRIDAHKHYPRDVIAGAMLGIGVQYMLTDSFNKKNKFSYSFCPLKSGGYFNFSRRI